MKRFAANFLTTFGITFFTIGIGIIAISAYFIDGLEDTLKEWGWLGLIGLVFICSVISFIVAIIKYFNKEEPVVEAVEQEDCVKSRLSEVSNKLDSEGYMVVENSYLVKVLGWTYEEIEQRTEDLTIELMSDDGEMDQKVLGDVSDHVEMAKKHPWFSKLLLYKEEMVGFIYYVFLTEEDYEALRNGEFCDEDITSKRIPPIIGEETHYCYFVDIAIEPEHKLIGLKLLIQSFIDDLCWWAKSHVYVREISAVGFTKEGAALCKRLGLRFEKYLPDYTVEENDKGIGALYTLKLLPTIESKYVKRKDEFAKLVELYEQAGNYIDLEEII